MQTTAEAAEEVVLEALRKTVSLGVEVHPCSATMEQRLQEAAVDLSVEQDERLQGAEEELLLRLTEAGELEEHWHPDEPAAFLEMNSQQAGQIHSA